MHELSFSPVSSPACRWCGGLISARGTRFVPAGQNSQTTGKTAGATAAFALNSTGLNPAKTPGRRVPPTAGQTSFFP